VSQGDGGWEPSIGDRVVLVATGEIGTLLRMSSTEWGLLCDIQFDPPPSGTGPSRATGPDRPVSRRVHASTELRPLA
jgi:hypothetical protein